MVEDSAAAQRRKYFADAHHTVPQCGLERKRIPSKDDKANFMVVNHLYWIVQTTVGYTLGLVIKMHNNQPQKTNI